MALIFVCEAELLLEAADDALLLDEFVFVDVLATEAGVVVLTIGFVEDVGGAVTVSVNEYEAVS